MHNVCVDGQDEVRGQLPGQPLPSQLAAPGNWGSKEGAAQPAPAEGFSPSGGH